MIPYIESKVMAILSDGMPRTHSQIHEEVYGKGERMKHGTQLADVLRRLARRGTIAMERVGPWCVYSKKGVTIKESTGVDVDPMALMDREIDMTMSRDDIILRLLEGGEVRTTAQLSNAYFSKARFTYDASYRTSIVSNTCSKLEGWGKVEKVPIVGAITGWRLTA